MDLTELALVQRITNNNVKNQAAVRPGLIELALHNVVVVRF